MTHQNWTSGLRWMRDKFAAWLASVTVFTFLWIAVGIAVAVLFVWDGVWSRHQAPSNLDPLTFQGAGWVMRLWTVFALAGAVWCFRHGARWVGGIMAFTWVLTSLMTYGHALGFIASGQTERYATGNAVEQTIVAQTESNADKVAKLEAMKAEVRSDLATRVAPLNAEITRLDTDGKINEDLATIQKERRAALEDAAQVKLDALDAQILALQDTDKTELVAGETAKAEVVKFDPLYVLLAEWTDGKEGAPDDADARNIAQRVGAFWAFLLEMIGGAGPALLYSIHAHMASRKPQTQEELFSDDIPAGHARWEGAEEDLDTMLSLFKRYKEQTDRKKRQAEDKAPPGSPLRLGNKEWVREAKQKIQAMYDEGASPQDIAESFGFTFSEYENHVRKMFNKKAAAKYLGQPVESEPDPRAPAPRTVGDYMPETSPDNITPPDELGGVITETPEETTDLNGGEVSEIGGEVSDPEQPKEYGVSLYEAPANEDPEDKDEAA